MNRWALLPLNLFIYHIGTLGPERPGRDHIGISYEPGRDHIGKSYEPGRDHVGSSYEPGRDHIETSYFMSQVGTT